MNNSKTYYGMTYFDENDLKESAGKHKVELEYYEIKRNVNSGIKYGIEIRKKEYINNIIREEVNIRENITNSAERVIKIIGTLRQYKVTPIGLNDVLEDLLKAI